MVIGPHIRSQPYMYNVLQSRLGGAQGLRCSYTLGPRTSALTVIQDAGHRCKIWVAVSCFLPVGISTRGDGTDILVDNQIPHTARACLTDVIDRMCGSVNTSCDNAESLVPQSPAQLLAMLRRKANVCSFLTRDILTLTSPSDDHSTGYITVIPSQYTLQDWCLCVRIRIGIVTPLVLNWC